MALSQYLMQAQSSTDAQLYTWTSSAPDFVAAAYPGPGSAQDVAVAGGGADMPDTTPDKAITLTDGSFVVLTDGSFAVTT